MAEKKPTKKALLEAFHAEMGRCVALTEKQIECTNWAVDRVNGRGYCGQHIAGIVQREDQERRAAEKRRKLLLRIDEYLQWTDQEAHVCGEVCYFSYLIQGPRLTDLIRPGTNSLPAAAQRSGDGE